MQRLTLLLSVMALAAVVTVVSACGGGGGTAAPGGGGGTTTQASFLLTDAPVDELSVFQVEVTGVSLNPTGAGAAVPVFPATANQTLVVNLLNLQGVNSLLATAAIPQGSYSSVEFTFINASAVDAQSNVLSVLPATTGQITMNMVPALVVGATPVTVQIDFDVNASISNLITGVGGSLTLSPTVFAVQQGAGGPGLPVRDLIGTVQSVGTQSLTMNGPGGAVAVTITATTRVEVGGVVSTAVTNLANVIAVNQIVEVKGQMANQVITATEIEVRALPPQGGGAATLGRQLEGVVIALSTGSFDVKVQDSRTSTLQPGSTQTVTVTGTTAYAYENPVAAATFANLSLGQRVRVFGSSASALAAQRVSLKDTRLTGTVVSVDAQLLQASVTVASSGGLAVSGITGFTNPATVQFTGTIPTGLAANAAFESSGVWSRSAAGVFDALGAALATAREAEVEGYVYSVTTSSPLTFSLTGEGERIGAPNPVTVTVALASNVVILERNKQTKAITPITEAALATGLAASTYGEVKAKGSYSNGTLTATQIRVDTGSAGAGEFEIEGSVYAVTTASPLAFTITGDGRRLGTQGSLTANVVLSANAVIGVKTPLSTVLAPLTLAELTLGLQGSAYHEVEAKGSWNATTQTLTASFVKVELGEDELEGTTYTVVASSPLSFTLTGAGEIGGALFTGTVTVVLSPTAVLTERGPGSNEYLPVTLANFTTRLGASEYSEVKIKGSYDAQSQTFTAGEVRARR